MKRDSTVITCVGIGVIFLVLQLNLTSVPPRTSVSTHSVKRQDTKSSVPKSTGLVADTESWVPKSTGHRKTDPPPPTTEKDITCDRSHNSYDLCAIKGSTVLDPTTATFFVVYPTSSTPEKPMEERVRPYPRKNENFTMFRIREVTLVSGPPTPKCDVQHHAPAIVFSAAGYTGNVWHDFNDGLIPLYVTINTIFPDQDVVLVISKARDWWVSKYRALLHSFSKHPIINLDNDTATHCFPSMAAGMISHGFMTIDPKLMPNSETFTHFRSFLDKAYGQNHEVPNENHNKRPLVYNTPEPRRPLLVLASRSGGIGRVLLNQNELKLEAEKIGFNVISFEPTTKTPLRDAYALINSSHAMVGMHGAALTHLLFLRPGSVFMQVVPLGAEWVADVCYERPARAIGIEYIEYRITPEESSLIEKYSKDEMILKDPVAYRSGKTWSHEIMTTYLKEQNVKLDMVRVREYLKEAYAKAKKLMDSEG